MVWRLMILDKDLSRDEFMMSDQDKSSVLSCSNLSILFCLAKQFTRLSQ